MSITSDIQIIRLTEALYNLRPGSTYLDNFRNYVSENDLEVFANALGKQFDESSNEDLAALVATNIHATGEEATAVAAYLVGQFNAVYLESRGKVVLDAVNLFSNNFNLSDSFNADVIASFEYSNVAANTETASDKTAVAPTMAFSVLLPTSDIQIIRLTEAIYNFSLGSTYLDNFRTYTAENGLEGFANALAYNFGASSNEELAAIVVTNLHEIGRAHV